MIEENTELKIPLVIAKKTFDYCKKVDLHVLKGNPNIQSVVSIAGEHGFRGIVVTLARLDRLVDAINKPIYGCKDLVPICAIDFPLGESSLDVRNYSIITAKEKGAKEVEVVAPYHLIAEKDFRKVYDDAQALMSQAEKCGISLKYVLDRDSNSIDDSVTARLCRIISSTKIKFVSTSLGFFDKKIDHADNVIKMRNVKSKSGCAIKVFVSSNDASEIASYVKAGADIVGLPWEKATRLVHAYEDLVDKKE